MFMVYTNIHVPKVFMGVHKIFVQLFIVEARGWYQMSFTINFYIIIIITTTIIWLFETESLNEEEAC